MRWTALFLLTLLLLPVSASSQPKSKPYFILQESYVLGLLSPDNRPSFPRNIQKGLDYDFDIERGQRVYFWIILSIPNPDPDTCTQKDKIPCVFKTEISGKTTEGKELVQELAGVDSLSLSDEKTETVYFFFNEKISSDLRGKATILITIKRGGVSLYELIIPANIG